MADSIHSLKPEVEWGCVGLGGGCMLTYVLKCIPKMRALHSLSESGYLNNP